MRLLLLSPSPHLTAFRLPLDTRLKTYAQYTVMPGRSLLINSTHFFPFAASAFALASLFHCEDGVGGDR